VSQITITVEHPAGLHARPAALFVKMASKFCSDIIVKTDDREANAKSILSVLTLGVNQGMEITIIAKGEDESAAITALQELIENNFEEV
jgi:phosphocarrier protein